MENLDLILWTCLWPIAWSLVELCDAKIATMKDRKPEDSGLEDWAMLAIWISGIIYFI